MLIHSCGAGPTAAISRGHLCVILSQTCCRSFSSKLLTKSNNLSNCSARLQASSGQAVPVKLHHHKTTAKSAILCTSWQYPLVHLHTPAQHLQQERTPSHAGHPCCQIRQRLRTKASQYLADSPQHCVKNALMLRDLGPAGIQNRLWRQLCHQTWSDLRRRSVRHAGGRGSPPGPPLGPLHSRSGRPAGLHEHASPEHRPIHAPCRCCVLATLIGSDSGECSAPGGRARAGQDRGVCALDLAFRGPGDREGPKPSAALHSVGSWAVKGCPL